MKLPAKPFHEATPLEIATINIALSRLTSVPECGCVKCGPSPSALVPVTSGAASIGEGSLADRSGPPIRFSRRPEDEDPFLAQLRAVLRDFSAVSQALYAYITL